MSTVLSSIPYHGLEKTLRDIQARTFMIGFLEQR